MEVLLLLVLLIIVVGLWLVRNARPMHDRPSSNFRTSLTTRDRRLWWPDVEAPVPRAAFPSRLLTPP